MPEQPSVGPDVVANVQYGGAYQHELRQMAQTGECKFCSPEFQSKKIFTFGGWIVLHNNYPTNDREGCHPAYQLLFVPIVHKDAMQPMSSNDWVAITELLGWCKREFDIAGGCLFARDGRPDLSGTTVRHRHVHYYVPRRVNQPRLRFVPRQLHGFVLRVLKRFMPRLFRARTIPIDIPAG